MPYVITEKCLGEVYAQCVDVWPVNCIHPGQHNGQEFMVINPEECIDCGVCEPECPAEAIVPDSDDRATEWAEQNRTYSALWPNLTRKGEVPADADEWKDKPGKAEQFSPEPGQV